MPKKEIPADSIILFPDIDAEFPGGNDSLKRFIARTIEYPPIKLYDCFPERKVYVTAVVELDGALTNIEILRGGEEDYNKAALDYIMQMPKWIPAKDRGENVKSKVIIPMVFML
ncbi:energy transducer TonB [Crocinitomicaceae bacterium]|nr:energy transducer TonB [Crocinitomicaceae bacterium]